MALPELDGGIEPIVFAGRDSNTGKSHSLPDRIESLCRCARGAGWLLPLLLFVPLLLLWSCLCLGCAWHVVGGMWPGCGPLCQSI